MNSLSLSPRLPAASDSLKLSDGRCVRWFVEALQLFRQFDETSSKDALREAKELLQQCVDTYPQDLLPSFYLAIADSVLGDMDQDEPIAIFEKFTHSQQFEVRAAAKYNLAAAYIETYDLGRFPKAAELLDELLAELKSQGAPVGIADWFKRIRDIFSPRRTRVEQLYYQALEARAYLRIHLDIWRPRWQAPVPADWETQAKQALNELSARAGEIEKNRRFLGEQEPEIGAWHWNNIGSVKEALAANARRLDDPKASTLAAEAEAAYKRALEAEPHFGSAKSNLGRLYLEITQDLGEAAKTLLEALEGAEDTDYTYYNLGLVRTLQRDREEAIRAFDKAPEMLKRRGQAATWTGARKILIQEMRKWGRDAEALLFLRELAKEYPGDGEVKRQIGELDPHPTSP